MCLLAERETDGIGSFAFIFLQSSLEYVMSQDTDLKIIQETYISEVLSL